MKKLLILIAAICLSPILYAQTDYNIEAITVINLGDGRLLFRTVSESLPVQGQLRLIDGRKSEYVLADFQDGLYNGTYQHFKSNKLREEGTYKEGRKHGTFKEFNSDGTSVKSEKKYIEGKADGMWTTYYTNGEPDKEKEYKNGLEHGIERKYDYETGELHTIMNYVEGKLHGKQTQLMKSNRTSYTIESEYKDGLLNGPYSETYVTGAIKKKGVYKNGKEEGVWIFNKPDGMPEREIAYKEGKKNGELKKFFTDGTVSDIETYKNEKLDGPKKEFYFESNGAIKSLFNYTEGKRNGKYAHYNQDGSIKEEGVYENGMKKNK